MYSGFVAVGVGAAVGAWMRWGLGIWLNPLFARLPLGTLAANLIGGLIMGVVLEVLARVTTLAPEWRLLLTTGFLGGLTTFSAFSGEIATLLLHGDWRWAALGIVLHVVGSLAMTLAGVFLVRWLFFGALA